MAYAEFGLADGGQVLVELERAGGPALAGRGRDVVRAASESFERTLSTVRDAAGAALSQFQEMAHQPDTVELRFGVKFDVEAGAVIARTGVEGQLEVKLTWHARSADTAGPGEAAAPAE
ncbi:MAG TPA: CU044_2847 family protein [Pseudonocardiaceae bacterium]|jgi:hypothetical protein|nr:CU044_2847 family protein [Pseudonocardiaceae bacterium]